MRKLFNTIALAALLVGASAPASAELVDYGTSGNWLIQSDDHDCTMSTFYNRSGLLAFDYDYRKNNVVVRFEAPQVNSLKDRDKRSLKVIFTNDTVESFDEGWGEADFMAYLVNGKTSMSSSFNGEQFLTDLAKYKWLAFFYKDTLVNSYNLNGTGAAITLLRQCAKKVGNTNPSDPFSI